MRLKHYQRRILNCVFQNTESEDKFPMQKRRNVYLITFLFTTLSEEAEGVRGTEVAAGAKGVVVVNTVAAADTEEGNGILSADPVRITRCDADNFGELCGCDGRPGQSSLNISLICFNFLFFSLTSFCKHRHTHMNYTVCNRDATRYKLHQNICYMCTIVFIMYCVI